MVCLEPWVAGNTFGLSMRGNLKNNLSCKGLLWKEGMSGQRLANYLQGNHVSVKKLTWIPFKSFFKCDFQWFHEKCNAPPQLSKGNWFPSAFSLPQWNGLVLIQSHSLTLTSEADGPKWLGSRGQDRNNWCMCGQNLYLSRAMSSCTNNIMKHLLSSCVIHKLGRGGSWWTKELDVCISVRKLPVWQGQWRNSAKAIRAIQLGVG